MAELERVFKHRYRNYSGHLKERFGERVQKVTIDAGFTCPNRDGTLGYGGCTYCNNDTFSQDYVKKDWSITRQIEEGIKFFSRKNKINKYLAYFQSYTNTYADLDKLKQYYLEGLSHPQVSGLVVGTRPDCIEDDLLDYLTGLAKDNYICIEYGIESTHNSILNAVNRCHTFEQAANTIRKTSGRGISIGAHLILGLPGENIRSILDQADDINRLPIDFLKLHQLQIVKGTVMAKNYLQNPNDFLAFSLEAYINLVIRFLERLRPDIIIERFVSQAPKSLLIAPRWGIKNFEVVSMIEKEMVRLNTWQGRYYHIGSAT